MKNTQKQYQVTAEDFERVNSDSNGNPRYAIHFTLCTPETYRNEDGATIGVYPSVCSLMNTIGGRKYHNKSYGGGIVFQSYNLTDTAKAINTAIAEENASYNMLPTKREYYAFESALLDGAYSDGFENEPYYKELNTDKEKITFIMARFKSEYQWNIDRIGAHKALTEWLAGLALDIPYMNSDILELFNAKEKTEKQQDKILTEYFSFMAMRLKGIEDYFNA